MAAPRRQGRAPHPPPERHRPRRLLDRAAREAQASGPSPRASRALGSRTAQGAAAGSLRAAPQPLVVKADPSPVPRPDADLVEMVCAPMTFGAMAFGDRIGDVASRKVRSYRV